MAPFLNVYNFIPFPTAKAKSYKDSDRHTGVITYTITTKTPLFIPNTSSSNAFCMTADQKERKSAEHPSYDFYSYREMEQNKNYKDDPAMPIIPGSELRGMVRQLYETLTDSCMGVLNEDATPVIRPGSRSGFLPGLLVRTEGGAYILEKAVCVKYKDPGQPKIYLSKEAPAEGKKLFVEVEEKSVQNARTGKWEDKKYIVRYSEEKAGSCDTEAYVLKGMEFRNKTGLHMFLQGKTKVADLNKGHIAALKKVIESYQEQPAAPKNCYKEYEKNLKEFLSGAGGEKFPVYYVILGNGEQQLLYLSPACITKEISMHTVKELAGAAVPCSSLESRCPACDLFGRIGESNEDALASKLRFTDAVVPAGMEAKDCYSPQLLTLPALAEPKLGATEFYLKKPNENAIFWTYDYYVTDKGLFIQKGKLRGRKYYWHQPDKAQDANLPKNVEKTDLNKTVRTVKPEITFTGKVYFDGISGKQLQQLKWILNCGEEGSGLAFKLGGGKPVGLGSVECKITDVRERVIGVKDNSLVYEEIPEASVQICGYDSAEVAFSQSAKEAFMLMCKYDVIEDIKKAGGNEEVLISYPFVQSQAAHVKQNGWVKEGFKWAVENHMDKKVKTARGYVIRKTLPEVKAAEGGISDVTLTYDETFGGQENRGNSQSNEQAPKCKNKGCSNRVTWNKKAGKWNVTCWECFNKRRG